MNKEKTIYIEADEEITSVISRVKKTKEQKVALVIPKGSIILGSIVNLKMLKKHEKNLTKEITIVTIDRTGRHLASEVGFEVMHSLEDQDVKVEKTEFRKPLSPKIEFKKESESRDSSQKKEPEITVKKLGDDSRAISEIKEKESKKEVSPKKKRLSKLAKRILIGFGILSFVAGVLAFLFVLPKATVTLSVRAEELRQEVNLEIKPQDKEDEQLGGELIESNQEVSKSYPATGRKNIGEKAKGTITIYNEWDSNAQPLVSGTRFVSSDGKVFRTTQAVNVPGTTVQSGKIVAGTANVTIEADQPGETYNIGPSSFNIPGLPQDKQAKIYGKSSQSMAGGLTREIKVVSKKDIDDARISLEEELDKRAKEELSKKVQGKKILDAAIKKDPAEENLSSKEGQQAEEFTLTLKQNFWTIAFDENKAKEKILAKIKETIPEDKELVEGKLENIEYKIVDITRENGLSLSISATAFSSSKLELERAKIDMQGKNKEEATQYFKQKKEITDVKVDLWPFWVSKIPLNRSRIEIKINIEASK